MAARALPSVITFHFHSLVVSLSDMERVQERVFMTRYLVIWQLISSHLAVKGLKTFQDFKSKKFKNILRLLRSLNVLIKRNYTNYKMCSVEVQMCRLLLMTELQSDQVSTG